MNNQKNVLIVDDTLNARKTIKTVLSDLDCRFVEASSGKQALRLASKERFSVVILDYGLPGGLSGIETLRKAKELKLKLPPVIMLTGFLEKSIEKEARSLGVFAFLTKAPLPGDRLKAVVLRALRQSGKKR